MPDRLTKSDWIKHGLRTLTNQGANALKVGSMATQLKVSRGSFYWHFEDIADFRSQLLRSWQERMTDQVIADIESEKVEPERLKRLMKRGFAGKRSLDLAIRYWAAEDDDVATVVASVDGRRVAYIAKLLMAAGVDPQLALHRAAFLYWAYLGQAVVRDPRLSSISTAAMDDIGGLFEK